MSDSVISESVNSREPAYPANEYVQRFQDLQVYRKARRLAFEIFAASKSFPKEESYSLADQLRRAPRSIGAQIAEAWAKRRYPKHFVSKLTDADGEQLETQPWLTVAYDSGCLSETNTGRLGKLCLEVGRLLGGMILKAEEFCNPDFPPLHEKDVDYTVSENAGFLSEH
jgi:four helix bundle protein